MKNTTYAIASIIEKNEVIIFSSMSPAKKAYEILCTDHGFIEFGFRFEYETARKVFFEYCQENDFLAVWDNF